MNFSNVEIKLFCKILKQYVCCIQHTYKPAEKHNMGKHRLTRDHLRFSWDVSRTIYKKGIQYKQAISNLPILKFITPKFCCVFLQLTLFIESYFFSVGSSFVTSVFSVRAFGYLKIKKKLH